MKPLLPALLLALLGCGESPLLELSVVTPEGADPLAGVDRLRLLVSRPAGQTEISVSSAAQFSFELELEVKSEVGAITLEGWAGQQLVARGDTPPLLLRPTDLELTLLVAPAGRLSRLSPRLPAPRGGLLGAAIPSLGLLLAGGQEESGAPVADAVLYDFFFHELVRLPPLPEPRADGLALACGSSCALLALGSGPAGLAGTLLRYEAGEWSTHADNLPAVERRSHAVLAELEDGSWLVVGGSNSAGPLDSLLQLSALAAPNAPQLQLYPVRLRTPRATPAVVASRGAVIIVGGQQPGGLPAEILYPSASSSQPLELAGPEVAGGAAAAVLSDGRVLVLGGRAADGTLLADAWLVDPTTLDVTHLPGALPAGRADHQLARVGAQLIVLGGVQAAGLAPAVEVFELDGASRLVQLAAPSLLDPRQGFAWGRLSAGSLLLAGGQGPAGLLDTLEIYQTGHSD